VLCFALLLLGVCFVLVAGSSWVGWSLAAGLVLFVVFPVWVHAVVVIRPSPAWSGVDGLAFYLSHAFQSLLLLWYVDFGSSLATILVWVPLVCIAVRGFLFGPAFGGPDHLLVLSRLPHGVLYSRPSLSWLRVGARWFHIARLCLFSFFPPRAVLWASWDRCP